jgi:two-component system sensor histidine kinase KdpD
MSRKSAHKFLPYIWSLVLIALMSLLGEFVSRSFEPTNLVMLYLLAVVISAIFWGRGPAITTAVVSVLIFDFLFIPPKLTFTVDQTQYILTFIGLFAVGVVISELAVKMRQRAIEAQKREAQTSALYHLNKDLASSHNLEETLNFALFHMNKLIGRDLSLYLKTEKSFSPWKVRGENLSDAEIEIFVKRGGASHRNESQMHKGTDIFIQSNVVFIPLLTGGNIIGFLSYTPSAESGELTADDKKLLEAMANQVALAIERMKLLDENRQIEVLQETEKLHKALLSSVSHDLRTPLVSITGAMSSLMESENNIDSLLRKELIETAYEESVRLNKLVSHLLDMARIEAGALKACIKSCDLREVIAVSLEELDEKWKSLAIQVEIPDDLGDVPMDFLLMTKVLGNLIENAAKFSYLGSPIAISADVENDRLQIRVQNHGEGILQEDLNRVFSKFYRAEGTQKIQGTGLGLSICKGLVELHKGQIWIESQPKKETIVHVELPLRIKDV